MSLRALDWDDELLRLFGVERRALPRVVPTTGDLGLVRRRGRTIPVRALVGDQQAAAFGLGGSREGRGVLNYGTGAFFLLHAGESRARVPGLLTSVARLREGRPCEFFLEGTVHAAGTSLHWLQQRLRLLEGPDGVDRACRRSARRLLALPAIGGLGAPRWDYRTPAAFYGLSSQSSPPDLVRGVTEGIAFLIHDIVSACREAGRKVGAARASGGLSRSAYLLQFQADLLRVPIEAWEEREGTALGAAMLAAEAAGLRLRPPAAKVRRFVPRMPAAEARRLARAWSLFVEAQRDLARDLEPLGVL